MYRIIGCPPRHSAVASPIAAGSANLATVFARNYVVNRRTEFNANE